MAEQVRASLEDRSTRLGKSRPLWNIVGIEARTTMVVAISGPMSGIASSLQANSFFSATCPTSGWGLGQVVAKAWSTCVHCRLLRPALLLIRLLYAAVERLRRAIRAHMLQSMSHPAAGSGTGAGTTSGETKAALMPHPSLRRVENPTIVLVTG